jgi:hypothetical protein
MTYSGRISEQLERRSTGIPCFWIPGEQRQTVRGRDWQTNGVVPSCSWRGTERVCWEWYVFSTLVATCIDRTKAWAEPLFSMQMCFSQPIHKRYNYLRGQKRFAKIQTHWIHVSDFQIPEQPQSHLTTDYARASRMLSPTPYPTTYPRLKKLDLLEKQARFQGQEQNFYRAPQTTFFHNGVNNAGVKMKASTGSGQDCTGVNDGSKNTVLVTYLADAWNWGADMFCECRVQYIEEDRVQGGYLVFFAWLGGKRDAFEDTVVEQLMWVRAVSYPTPLCHLNACINTPSERTLFPRRRRSRHHRDPPP